METTLSNRYQLNGEEIREYCLSKPGVSESFPFDEYTLVFKVGKKMFLLLSLDADPLQFNVKCDPELAIQLREEHPSVLPGYHMNKKHWNTVLCDGGVPIAKLKQWIDHSYQLVSKDLRVKRG